ncbi:hypothetical protein B7463_g3408, partial [Scytalidium lignicola]
MNTRIFMTAVLVVSSLTNAFPTLKIDKRQTYDGVATVNPNPTNAYGSCGVISPDSSLTVAISNTWMKSESPSPYCGRQIKITNTGPTTDESIGGKGRTVTVTVEDTCMGCNETHLDLSVAAWNVISNKALYSVVGISCLEYDGNGRVTVETVSWSSGYSAPEGSVTSYTNRNSYTYDPAGFDIVSAHDPQDHTTVNTYDIKITQGPIVRKELPLAQAENFTYDQIGRCIEYTDPFGNKTSNSYTVGELGNTVTSTSSLGYVTKQIFDSLAREVQQADNGDPTQQQSPLPNRVLSETAYDSLSRIISKTDELGLKTTNNAYDSFNRLLSVTDTNGNTQTYTFDDSSLTKQCALNGDRRGAIQLDGFGRNIKVTTHADSDDPNTKYCLVKEYQYEGSKNVLQATLFQQPLDNSTANQLEISTRAYNVENAVTSEKTVTRSDLADNAFDSLERNAQYDIFGRVYTHSKTVQYHDGRSFNYQGAVNIYDNCNQLVTLRNQLDQEEKYDYDANRHMADLTRYDTSKTSYEYDPIEQLISVIEPNASRKLTKAYLPNGRVSQIKMGDATVQYDYSLDGSSTAVRYPDGAEQKYTLDSTGRIIQSTDAQGAVQKTGFNEYSLVSWRRLGNDTVSYKYGIVNHTQWQLLGHTITGVQDLQLTLSYDGFGRVNHSTVINTKTSNVVLDIIYTYNSKGKLSMVEVSSEVSTSEEFSYQRQLLYDGLNQRTDPGYVYDKNCRLLTDDKGRIYQYSDNDELIGVKVSESGTSFQYYPNGSLSVHNSGAASMNLYYDGGAINAAQTQEENQDGWTSYLMEPGRRLAAYKSDSNSATYYIESQGSTALQLEPAGNKATYYQPYGSADSSTTTQTHDFGYRQEFTDNVSGLVYLRSRFYPPDNAAFITLDSTRKENRYTFCSGDPVNLFDGTGHSETEAMGIGIAVGFAVTAIAAVLTEGLAALVFGPECVAASIAVGAVSGATGNVAGDATQAVLNHDNFSAMRAGEDVLSGAIGGAVGAGSGGAAGRAAMSAALENEWSQAAIVRVGSVTSGVVGGASGSFSQSASTAIAGNPAGIGADEMRIFETQAEANEDAGNFTKARNALRKTPENAGFTMCPTIVGHGLADTMFLPTTDLSNGGPATYMRPMKGKLFAQLMMTERFRFAPGNQTIKLVSCYGALGTGQALAEATERDVFASYLAVYADAAVDGWHWKEITP